LNKEDEKSIIYLGFSCFK